MPTGGDYKNGDVLSHGMGEIRASFRHLVPLLVAAGHRVASVDVRGHGESSVGWSTYAPAEVGADLLAVVRDIDAGPAVLLGNSSSAAAVVFAAAEEPELVVGIVQIGAFVSQDKPNAVIRVACVIYGVLRGYGLTGDDAVDATRALRSALHGFVALEATGGFGLPCDVDRSYHQLVAGLDVVLCSWPGVRQGTDQQGRGW
jgi:pimeloyl-ACP methyl ester carboxylesterase